jgi:hypothetical protein
MIDVAATNIGKASKRMQLFRMRFLKAVTGGLWRDVRDKAMGLAGDSIGTVRVP